MSKFCSCKELEKGAAKVGCYWDLNYSVAGPKVFISFCCFRQVEGSELCDSLMQGVPEETSLGVKVGSLWLC